MSDDATGGYLPNPDRQKLASELADSVTGVAREALAGVALRAVTTLAPPLLHIEAASATIVRGNGFVTVAASEQSAFDLDATQYSANDGPCVHAARRGRAVHANRASGTNAWRAIDEAARRSGIESVLSTPLLGRTRPIGALNLYSSDDEFSDEQRKLALLLATEAVALLNAPLPLGGELVDRLEDGLVSRDLIALAQGIVMERDNVSADESYTRLRRDSQATDVPLREGAQHIVRSRTCPTSPQRQSST